MDRLIEVGFNANLTVSDVIAAIMRGFRGKLHVPSFLSPPGVQTFYVHESRGVLLDFMLAIFDEAGMKQKSGPLFRRFEKAKRASDYEEGNLST